MTDGDWLAGKSEQTPIVSTVHHPLGHEGLWHTPSKKVPVRQQLTAYQQNIARALMRQGHDEHSAIAIATAAVAHWMRGEPSGAMRGKPHSETRAAASRTHAEWEALRASHHAASVNPWFDTLKAVDRYERDDLQYRVPSSGEEQGADRPKPRRAFAEEEQRQQQQVAGRRRKKRLRKAQGDDNPWVAVACTGS